MVILIPARAHSQRIKGKALKLLGGKPLIAWTIESARTLSGPSYVFPSAQVIVCSEDDQILECAMGHHAEVWRRPMFTASDDAPDLTWLRLALEHYPDEEMFMVRRPTSPFIGELVLRRAWADFLAVPEATAMRAMRPVTEHPNKMWLREGLWMVPPGGTYGGIEAHSCPTQVLPRVYVQTAGLEIIRRSTLESGSLTGDRVLPLFLDGPEALDLNTPDDWEKAEAYVRTLTA